MEKKDEKEQEDEANCLKFFYENLIKILQFNNNMQIFGKTSIKFSVLPYFLLFVYLFIWDMLCEKDPPLDFNFFPSQFPTISFHLQHIIE